MRDVINDATWFVIMSLYFKDYTFDIRICVTKCLILIFGQEHAACKSQDDLHMLMIFFALMSYKKNFHEEMRNHIRKIKGKKRKIQKMERLYGNV